jgi:hypothetical protein
MLSLKEIKPFYPESLHNFERFIIREYLDVGPFLFNKKDEKKILLFPEYFKQAKLN